MRARPLLALLWAIAVPLPAAAYEFEIDARTVGQAYQLRWTRLSEQDRLLNRRRFMQSLGLEVWGILEPAYDAARPDEPPLAPFDLFVSFQVRILHDFGEYTRGNVIHGDPPVEEEATKAVPELGREDFNLEVLWAHVGARDILGRIDFALGRVLIVDSFDWMALDGLTVAARLPGHVAVEGMAGWRVRDSSPLGSPTHEPDGTSSSECLAFVAGAEDAFQPDGPIGCDQRERAAPTFGLGLASHGLRWLSARLSYRRTVSGTADGLYPDAAGEAPSYGVLEEKLAGSLRFRLLDGDLVPFAAARWNLLLGQIDEAHAGVRLAYGRHALTPELLYSFPSFDGDSIFNVFTTDPYWDGRLTYDLGLGRARAYARAYARRFANSVPQGVAWTVPTDAWSAGGAVGGRLRATGGAVRADLFYEDGYGGLRGGADVSGRWRLTRKLELDGRASLIRYESDGLPDRDATSVGGEAGALLTLGPGMAIHFLGEANSNRFGSNLRLLAVLDLAFRPEH